MTSKDLSAFAIASTIYLSGASFFFFNSISLTGENEMQKASAPLAVHYKVTHMEIAKEKTQEKVEKKIIKDHDLPKVEPKTVEIAKNQTKPLQEENHEKPLPPVEKAMEENISTTYQLQAIKAEKNHFLHQLKEKINEHKLYPRRARMREIEGDVNVEFIISKEGAVEVTYINGNKVFEAYAKKAILDTFPLTIPTTIHKLLPMQIALTLKYSLS